RIADQRDAARDPARCRLRNRTGRAPVPADQRDVAWPCYPPRLLGRGRPPPSYRRRPPRGVNRGGAGCRIRLPHECDRAVPGLVAVPRRRSAPPPPFFFFVQTA